MGPIGIAEQTGRRAWLGGSSNQGNRTIEAKALPAPKRSAPGDGSDVVSLHSCRRATG
jgi:hypothetical protein